jgi:ABC-type phosphate transport system permease subunit
MVNAKDLKKLVTAVIAVLISVPSIVIGFYLTYQVVTNLGN